MTSQFDTLKNIINSNDAFSRQHMIKVHNLYGPTVDTYRRQFEVLGFIKTIRRGKYVVLKKVTKEYTTSTLRKEYSIALAKQNK